MTYRRRAHVSGILVIAIALLDFYLLPIDVELIGDDRGQRVSNTLSRLWVLGNDRKCVVGMHLDIGVWIDWRDWRSGAALLRE